MFARERMQELAMEQELEVSPGVGPVTEEFRCARVNQRRLLR
jgi:hypothetical protein